MKIPKMKVNEKVVRNMLYILGVFVFLYYIYILFGTCSYIGELVKAGEIKFMEDIGKVIEYIMSKTFSYLFYSIILLILGKISYTHEKENKM